jgi:hypothetical protein
VIPRRLLAYFFFIVGLSGLGASEFNDGNIRLIINEKTGLFSLFFLTDPAMGRYEPFLANKNPQTSYLSVNVNGKSFRPDKDKNFRVRVETFGGNPVIMFDSSVLEVTEIFTFIKTANSSVANGVKITVYLKNKTGILANVGLRALFDTYLGEGFGNVPFVINGQNITKETVVKGLSNDSYWASRGKKLSIMGNVAISHDGSGKNPDFIHFANWEKFNDAIWKAPYHEGRSFTDNPYSINDSAVCYYYEGVPLKPEQSFHSMIFLAAEDTDGIFKLPNNSSHAAAMNSNDYQPDLHALQELLDRLDRFIAGEIELSELELTEIDLSITRLKARHGLR